MDCRFTDFWIHSLATSPAIIRTEKFSWVLKKCRTDEFSQAKEYFSLLVKIACIKQILESRPKLMKLKGLDSKRYFWELWYRLLWKRNSIEVFSNWSENHLKLKTEIQARHNPCKYGSTSQHNFNPQLMILYWWTSPPPMTLVYPREWKMVLPFSVAKA